MLAPDPTLKESSSKAHGLLAQTVPNGAAIGGLKVITEHGWFAARPSGADDIYKIYADRFRGAEHLRRIACDAQAIIDATLGANASLA